MITKHSRFEQGGGAVRGVNVGPVLSPVHSADFGSSYGAPNLVWQFAAQPFQLGPDLEATMRRNNDFERGLFYYGTYKGFGAIFSLFFLFFIALPIKVVKLLVRASR
jgi:hypothetical protein